MHLRVVSFSLYQKKNFPTKDISHDWAIWNFTLNGPLEKCFARFT
jgi:hypothetical protein